MSKNKEGKIKETPQKEQDTVKKKVSADQGQESAAAEAGSSEENPQPDYETQIADLKDKYLRLQADFDNYRKRTNAEKIEMIKTASESVISSLLPVIDDMERAMAAFKTAAAKDESVAQEGSASKALADGVDLIYNKFMGILKQRGVEECEVLDKEFDENTAEAIAQIPAPSEDKKGIVLDVTQKGYKLGDKVIRYAKVVVGC